MKGPIHFDSIMEIMLGIFPEMELGEDNDGQLIVYTGWECTSSDNMYAPMKQMETNCDEDPIYFVDKDENNLPPAK